MKKYDLKKSTLESRTIHDIKNGASVFDSDPELIQTFSDLQPALKELEKYESYVEYYAGGNRFYLTEYFVEEYEVDEDGEFIESCSIWNSEILHGTEVDTNGTTYIYKSGKFSGWEIV